MKFHHFVRDENGWETLDIEDQFENPHMWLGYETVKSPGAKEPHYWTVVRRKAAVVVAPRTREGKWLLIRQERIPVRRALWEFPAGQIDTPAAGEELHKRAVATVHRELQEETGYQLAADGALQPLGHFFSSQGFTDEFCFLYLASPVVESDDGHAHDGTESILACRGFTTPEMRKMIASSEICDGNTLAVWARLCATGFPPVASASSR